ncbi:MAG: PIG-L family deacetylase [Acidobacteriota bacterium]
MALRLLNITAHPDDECFAFGGALALAAQHGVETSVLCLTDGQAAKHRGASTSAEDLGRIRRAEFAASCAILGVTHHDLLDYQDAQLEHANFSELAAKLVQRIRSFRPHVVLTFGQDGGANTHPDHTMVSCATTAAVHWAASPKRFSNLGPTHRTQRLYHQTTNYFLPERPEPLPAPWTVTLDIRSVFAIKQQAFAAHHSQAPLMEATRTIFEQHGQYEHYILEATPNPKPAEQTTDLFEGVTE